MKILITGCSAMQVNSDRRVNQLISNLESLKVALEYGGHTVEWRAITVGESLSHFDHCIVCLMPLASWGSRYMGGALWALYAADKVTLTADDWQVRGIWPSIKGLLKRSDYFEKTIWSHWAGKVSDLYKSRLLLSLDMLQGRNWPWPMLVPCWEGGDLSALNLPTELTAYDPSPFMKSYPCVRIAGKSREWVFASLTAKDGWLSKQKQMAKWPIACYGNVRKGQEKLAESDLQLVYSAKWGVMSPPHDVSKAGWFRVRFHMAAAADCIVLCGHDEACILGPSYQHNIQDYELMSDKQLEEVSFTQWLDLSKKSWDKEHLYEVINRAVSR